MLFSKLSQCGFVNTMTVSGVQCCFGPLTWIASTTNIETFKIYFLCSAEESHTGLKQHEKVKK